MVGFGHGALGLSCTSPERQTAFVRVLLHSKSHIVDDIPGFVRELDVERADADLTAEEAGRLCYLSGHRPNPKTATNPNYLLNICNERHYSVLGHASASFYIDDISRNCTHEIIRHRWFTFSEVSQRYVDVGEFKFALHPGLVRWLDTDLETDVGREDMMRDIEKATKEAYSFIADELVRWHGYTRKQARQAARHVLPGGTETKILMSGNLRAWRDFLAQRLSPHADDEIRNVALKIFEILKAEFPNSFQDFDSQGMITVERLIQRAMERHDVMAAYSDQPRYKSAMKFVEEVREILTKGLWVLKEDPWEEEESVEDVVRSFEEGEKFVTTRPIEEASK